MRVRELRALLDTLPSEAWVLINGQEYHFTGTYTVGKFAGIEAVDFHVGLGWPDESGSAAQVVRVNDEDAPAWREFLRGAALTGPEGMPNEEQTP